MKRFMSYTLCLLCCCACVQQGVTQKNASPGGVPDPKQWWVAQKSTDGQIVLTDQMKQQPDLKFAQPVPMSESQWLNYQPALLFNGDGQALNLSLADENYTYGTVYLVYYPKNPSVEQALLSFERNSKAVLIASTAYTTDLVLNRYEQHYSRPFAGGRIYGYAYCHEKDVQTASVRQTLRLGSKPVLPDIPVQPFEGLLTEVITYDRFLSPEECAKVEGYLALKYGITLKTTYRNSKGEIIWDTLKNKAYFHRVAGIARDDASNLYARQFSGEHQESPLGMGLVHIANTNATNPSRIPMDHTYLICGDNDQPLMWGEKTVGHPLTLRRKWQMCARGSTKSLKTELRFDTRRLKYPLEKHQTLWLCIDRGGSDEVNLGALEYYRATQTTKDGIAFFNDISWDPDGSGSDVFTFSAGPALMANCGLTPPECATSTDGALEIRAQGGRPPYRFTVLGPDSAYLWQWSAPGNAIRNLGGIVSGEYRICVEDAENRTWRDTFFVQGTDAPVAKLLRQYELPETGALLLDASEGIPLGNVKYEWLGPSGNTTCSPRISITEPGCYRLKMTQGTCASRQEINIRPFPQSVFEGVDILPNPSLNGTFTLLIRLRHTTSVVLWIGDATGRQLQQHTLAGSDYYRYNGKLNTSGAFLIALTADGQTLTKRLTVGN